MNHFTSPTLFLKVLCFILIGFCSSHSLAKDGYKLWLQYYPVNDPEGVAMLMENIHVAGNSSTLDIIRQELVTAYQGYTGKETTTLGRQNPDKAMVFILKYDAVPEGWNKIEGVELGKEGFVILEKKMGDTSQFLIRRGPMWDCYTALSSGYRSFREGIPFLKRE